MKIRIFSGEEYAPVTDAICPDIRGKQISLPEEIYKHPSTISREIIDMCQRCFDKDVNLTILTYSTVVLNSVALWAVSTDHYNVVEATCVFKNGEKVFSLLSKFGDYDKSIREIIDVDMSIKIKIGGLIIDKYYEEIINEGKSRK